MARNRLSTGILSPLQTDISLNDSSFSFGSPSVLPEYDKRSINKYTEKVSDIKSLCKKTLQESSDTLQAIPNIKKQPDINIEREEKFKDSYEVLRQSMDELFFTKTSTSFLSPVSNNAELENVTAAEKTSSSNVNEGEFDEESQKFEDNKSSTSETCSRISNKKFEIKVNKASSLSREQKNNHLKNISSMKLSANNNNAKLSHGNKAKTGRMSSSSTQTKPLEEKQSKNKKLQTSSEVNERAVRDFQFKSQQKLAVPCNKPTAENMSLSIEKSVEITVSMEMDKIRHLILDQNLTLQKEIFKLQDMVQKQAAVTGYLFSVVDELLEANKKLTLKHK